MDFAVYTIIVFILFMATLVLFIYFLSAYLKLPEVTQPVVLNPDLIACSPEQTLEAYIYGYPNKAGCPPWTNDLLVGTDYRLYLRDFVVSPECCYFSSDPNDRNIITKPRLCVAKSNPLEFSLQDLNANPYQTNGQQVSFTVPACNGVAECFSLVLNNGLYSLFSYTGNIDINPADWTFQLSDNCLTITQLGYQGKLVGELQGTSWVYLVPQNTIPPTIQTIVNALHFNGGAPMAGVPLT